MNSFVIATFYQFAPLENYESMREPLLDCMKNNHVKGTIIVAAEGVNGTFCGLQEQIEPLMAVLTSYPGLENMSFKFTFDQLNPFSKAKVKLRKEIVTLGVPGIKPQEKTGIHVNPEEWNALLADPEVVVVDTRNTYEVMLGTFKNAINPNTENFRDFPQFVEDNLLDQKKKKIAMFCTGGIRCEKSTAYLKHLGFEEVYQLNGGILNYLQNTPEEKSLWEGTCFVFDDRVALNQQLQGHERGTIDLEWKNNHRKKPE